MWDNPQDIPGLPGDGSTWGYCLMSEVSQDMGISQYVPDIPRYGYSVPGQSYSTCKYRSQDGPTYGLMCPCLKCPRTWVHPRTSRGYGPTWGCSTSEVSQGWSYMGFLGLKCPSIRGHPRSRGWGHPRWDTLCPMSEVSQDMGTSQDILEIVHMGPLYV